MSLTITHTHAAGTLIDGTGRADGSAEVLKTVANPYTGRASRGGGRATSAARMWRARDSRANTALVDATKAALEAAGSTVAVEIDDTYRSAERLRLTPLHDRRTGSPSWASKLSAPPPPPTLPSTGRASCPT